MRKLLVIGGEGNMTGMRADHRTDDMEGLLQGLSNTRQYRQIVFYFTKQFLQPPADSEVLLPFVESTGVVMKTLTEGRGQDASEEVAHKSKEERVELAREYPEIFHRRILRAATSTALSLLYENIFSFLGDRQIVLIFTESDGHFCGLFPIASPAPGRSPQDERVTSQKLPITSGIKDWPIVFSRFDGDVLLPQQLVYGDEAEMPFSWCEPIPVSEILAGCKNALSARCKVTYPATGPLGDPRALLADGNNGGFLLAIPRPSNMRNFSITLRTGKGIEKAHLQKCEDSPGTVPERNWMTRKEVAEAIGKSTDTVDNYCRDGKFEVSKVGREVRISKVSVKGYLDGGA
jgi:excisionase family DNA binding protein